MNHLAHLFLSGNDTEVMLGNFIADYVKGSRKNDYPVKIRSGIELHREIDHFTDTHSITSVSRHRLYPTQRKYAAVVLDLFFDHFLARDFHLYSPVSLEDFASAFYREAQLHHHLLPQPVQYFLPYMTERNWLKSYSTVDGIGSALTGLSRRVRFPNNMQHAREDLLRNYREFEKDFAAFFPELRTFAAAKR